MKKDTRAKRTAPQKRRAYSLVEVLCAIVVLVVAVLATFATISYALTATLESRERMASYSKAEYAGLSNLALKTTSTDPYVVTEEKTVKSTTSGGLSREIDLKMTTYKVDPSLFKWRLTQSPVFVVFMK